jgi:hypothetical protein
LTRIRWLVVDGDGVEEAGRGCQKMMATKMTAVALCSRRLIFSLPDAASLFSTRKLVKNTEPKVLK